MASPNAGKLVLAVGAAAAGAYVGYLYQKHQEKEAKKAKEATDSRWIHPFGHAKKDEKQSIFGASEELDKKKVNSDEKGSRMQFGSQKEGDQSQDSKPIRSWFSQGPKNDDNNKDKNESLFGSKKTEEGNEEEKEGYFQSLPSAYKKGDDKETKRSWFESNKGMDEEKDAVRNNKKEGSGGSSGGWSWPFGTATEDNKNEKSTSSDNSEETNAKPTSCPSSHFNKTHKPCPDSHFELEHKNYSSIKSSGDKSFVETFFEKRKQPLPEKDKDSGPADGAAKAEQHTTDKQEESENEDKGGTQDKSADEEKSVLPKVFPENEHNTKKNTISSTHSGFAHTLKQPLICDDKTEQTNAGKGDTSADQEHPTKTEQSSEPKTLNQTAETDTASNSTKNGTCKCPKTHFELRHKPCKELREETTGKSSWPSFLSKSENGSDIEESNRTSTTSDWSPSNEQDNVTKESGNHHVEKPSFFKTWISNPRDK